MNDNDKIDDEKLMAKKIITVFNWKAGINGKKTRYFRKRSRGSGFGDYVEVDEGAALQSELVFLIYIKTRR